MDRQREIDRQEIIHAISKNVEEYKSENRIKNKEREINKIVPNGDVWEKEWGIRRPANIEVYNDSKNIKEAWEAIQKIFYKKGVS